MVLPACLLLAFGAYVYPERRRAGSFTGSFSGSLGHFFRWLFPKAIYTHPSTKTDALYLLSFPLVAGLIFKPALGFSTAALSYRAVEAAMAHLPDIAPLPHPTLRWTIIALTAAFTVASALAADLMFYLHHLALHKRRFLWEFHKVHHSAEVLTPLTDYRAHPLEILTYTSRRGLESERCRRCSTTSPAVPSAFSPCSD